MNVCSGGAAQPQQKRQASIKEAAGCSEVPEMAGEVLQAVVSLAVVVSYGW